FSFRYLATGESFRSLSFQFRICHSWISVIIKQVADSITKTMFKLIMPSPTEEQLPIIANTYLSTWNFPNCVGSIDGKHIRIRAPKNSGSTFFNYKEFYSIVMLAVVDAECKFVAIVIVGDETFALHENLMKPYPRKQTLSDPSKAVYNYRQSQARRTTENAFGILCAYFRISFQPIATVPETTDQLITCACILHSMLREAKLLAPTQVHFDDALPYRTKTLLELFVAALTAVIQMAAPLFYVSMVVNAY
ncbi:hypothetical protein B7P43_G10715, partial [Cryptotermes secundus]